MSAPQQLRDGAAHRVADRDHRAGAEFHERRRAVVGAVGEAEHGTTAHTAAVAAQVGCDDVEGLAQWPEHLEPVEPTARAPAVEQEQCRRARRTGDLTNESGAATGQQDAAATRQRWTVGTRGFEPGSVSTVAVM